MLTFPCSERFLVWLDKLPSWAGSAGGHASDYDPLVDKIKPCLCLIPGLIIDAFGELRDQQEQVKEDMEVSLSVSNSAVLIGDHVHVPRVFIRGSQMWGTRAGTWVWLLWPPFHSGSASKQQEKSCIVLVFLLLAPASRQPT